MFKKVASNTISQIISKIFTAIISIFLLNLLTNYLSLEYFWEYSKVYNYLWIFAFLADLWLYTIAVREISNKTQKEEKIIWNIMTLRFLLWIIIIFLAIIIAFFIPGYNWKITLISIFIVSIFTLVSLLNSSILSLMQANMKIEFSLISIVLWKIINLSFIAYIIFILFPVNSPLYEKNLDLSFVLIIFAWLVWIIVNTILNYIYANKICKIRFLFDFEYIKHIFKISIPYWVALFLSVVYFKIDIIIISVMEESIKSNLSIALYSLPMKIVEVIMVLWWFYLNSILPSLSRDFKEKNTKDLTKTIDISYRFLLAFWMLILFLWILFRENIIEIIANKDYLIWDSFYNSANAMIIVLFVVVFYFISLLFIYIFIASNNQKIILKINIFITLFNIIWNIVLIPKLSFIWAWIITLLSQIILLICSFIYSRKIIKFSIPKIYTIKIIFISIFCYLIWFYLIKNHEIWLFLDLTIYWWLLFIIYSFLVFLIFKKDITSRKSIT